MDRGGWQAMGHRVTESDNWSDLAHTHMCTSQYIIHLTYHIDILLISYHHKKKGEYSTIRYFETQRERGRSHSQILLEYIVIHSILLSTIVTNLWNVTNLQIKLCHRGV